MISYFGGFMYGYASPYIGDPQVVIILLFICFLLLIVFSIGMAFLGRWATQ
jgi:hypothetical protein